MNNTPDDIALALQRAEAALSEFAETYLRKASTKIAGRAIGTYMRSDKGKGPRRPDDAGPLRIVSTRLSRSIAARRGLLDEGGQPEGIMSITVANGVATLIKGSEVPYAAAHEFGYTGPAKVPAHQRRSRRGMVAVREHQRRVRIVKRAYLLPALQNVMPSLKKMAEKDLVTFLNNALQGGHP